MEDSQCSPDGIPFRYQSNPLIGKYFGKLLIIVCLFGAVAAFAQGFSN